MTKSNSPVTNLFLTLSGLLLAIFSSKRAEMPQTKDPLVWRKRPGRPKRGSLKNAWINGLAQGLATAVVGGLGIYLVHFDTLDKIINGITRTTENLAMQTTALLNRKTNSTRHPLGLQYATLIVKVAQSEQIFHINEFPEYDLKIRTGELTVIDGSIVLSRLSVISISKNLEIIQVRDIGIFAGQIFTEFSELNCGFTIEVLSSREIFQDGEIVVMLKSYTLEANKGSLCPIRLGLN